MKLLIVDDEHYIVNHLLSIVSQYFGDDLEVTHAYSGVAALELLENSHVDMMLLDIHMPGISGIEVSKIVTKKLPRCKIIFLTAYDKFDYIYQVSGIPNVSYLLKTESDEIILKEIQKNIARLLEEQRQLTILDEASQKAFLLKHLILQPTLREILLGSPLELIRQEVDFLGEDFMLDLTKPFYIMYMQVRQKSRKDSTENAFLHTTQYLQLADKLLFENFSYAMLDLDNHCYLWFFQPQPANAEAPAPFSLLKNMAEELSTLSASFLHRNAVLILYPGEITALDVCGIYPNLTAQADLHMIASSGLSSVFIYENSTSAEHDIPTDKSYTEKYFQELNFHLYQGNSKEFLLILSDIQAQCILIHSMHSLSNIKIYNTTALMLINYIDLYHLQTALASKIAIYPLYYLNDFKNWTQAFSYLAQCASHILQLGNLKTADKIDSIIAKIKLYINSHLHESLNLSTLSSLVSYNETYISHLFRQHTGIKLSDYILAQRVSKAKELLSNTSLSINQVADMTGFDTAQYFSLVFKKAAGMSPSDFRRLYPS